MYSFAMMHRSPAMVPSFPRFLVFGVWIVLGGVSGSALADESKGARIYRELCASCHGAKGEGVADKCPDPLEGDKSVLELSKYIHETMPEDEPEKCVDEDAKAVAEFIHQEFYSEIARVRNRPPRISLARLTKRQYEETIADLLRVARSDGNRKVPEQGLNANYQPTGKKEDKDKDKEKEKKKEGMKRVDGVIDFHFGKASPDDEKVGEGTYNINWSGGLLAEETGLYELVLVSNNGVRLWLNDEPNPTIDAGVRSGDATRFTATRKLLGGRVYPIRIEFKRAKDEEANITFLWKPPGLSEHVVPSRQLFPSWYPPVLTLESELPPDDSSYGYERGVAISKEWELGNTQAAIEVVDKIIADLDRLAGVKKEDSPEKIDFKHLELIGKLASRMVSGRLTIEGKPAFVEEYWKLDVDRETKIRRILFRALKSPEFLYPTGPASDPKMIPARKLALILWDSSPDQELIQASLDGKLATEEGLRKQALRMTQDPRAIAKLKYFLRHWMQLERGIDVTKDAQAYPGFSPELLTDLRTSLELFIDQVLTSDASDMRELLLADYLIANDRMIDFYGLGAEKKGGFQKITVDGSQRAGVLTHPYMMVGLAYHKASSPIHRGVFLAKNVLGRTVKIPPIAVAPLDESIDSSLTTRERVMVQTKPEACQSCHSLINPLGFSLENYDAVGRFRTMEKEKSIDARGRYIDSSGREFEFAGARQLAEFLAASPDVHESFVEHAFHHCVQQPVFAYGPETLERLVGAFRQEQYHIRKLFAEIAVRACKD